MKTIGHFCWARTEAQARELQRLGWRAAKQRTVHHHNWAILLEWTGDGEPKWPQSEAA